MKRRDIIVIAAGAALMAATVFLLYPRPPQPVKGVAYKYLYCSQCAKEWNYSEAQLAKGCPRCESKVVPTVASMTDAPPGGNFGPLTSMLMVELVAVLGILVFLYRPRTGGPVKEDYEYTKCKRCKQRLRFAAEKVGLIGKCPRCNRDVQFAPSGDEEERL